MRNGTAPQSKSGFDIWSLGKQLQKKQNPQGGQQKTIIVLGQHNSGTLLLTSGKSSFVKILRSETDSQVKPTGALQYTFIRRSAIRKQLVHSYEVAGRNLRGIIQSLISKQNYQHLIFAIVVDLSTPSEAIDSVVEWLQIVKEETNRFVQKLEDTEQREYIEGRVGRWANYQDSTKIEPVLVQTVVVGNKYDLYQKFDPEVRKWIARSLRYVALTNGCSLVYCSIRVQQLTAQVRSIFQTLFFGQNPSNLGLSQKDHMKPIFILNGHDNINAMTLPHPGSLPMISALKKHVSGLVPPKQQKKNEALQLAKYKQPRIDSLVEEKQRELQKISKDYRVIRSERNIDSPYKG